MNCCVESACLGRPRGEVRAALYAAVERLAGTAGAVSCKEVAASACVGMLATETTMRNMARAGEIVKVGQGKHAGSTHWHALYALPTPDAEPPAGKGIDRLAQAMQRLPAGT